MIINLITYTGLLMLALGGGAIFHIIFFYEKSLPIFNKFFTKNLHLREQKGISANPLISILMCAYNEESVLEAKIENLLSLTSKSVKHEILIYDDCSNDKTSAILNKLSAKITHIRGESRAGKSKGINTLAAKAKGELLIFTDANTMLKADVCEVAANAFHEDLTLGCLCGHIISTNASKSNIANIGVSYWDAEERLKEAETKYLGSTIVADGALFAIRAELFKPVPEYIIDDMYTSLRICCNHLRVVQSMNFIGFEKVAESIGDEFKRKRRIACRSWNCQKYLRHKILKLSFPLLYAYISHKFLRWFSFFWLLLFILGTTLTFFSLVGLTQIIISMILLVNLCLFAKKKFRKVLNKIKLVLSVQLGIIDSLRGKTYSTWSPPNTSR